VVWWPLSDFSFISVILCGLWSLSLITINLFLSVILWVFSSVSVVSVVSVFSGSYDVVVSGSYGVVVGLIDNRSQ
jgi:hypothetical protein